MKIKEPKKKHSLARAIFVESIKLLCLWAILSPFVSQCIYDRLIFHPDKANYDQSCEEPFHPPLLVIAGKDDDILPWKYSQSLYNAALPVKHLAIIDNLPHLLSRIDNVPYLHAVQDFINRLP
jgi:pimeloyl-ACP methyl ester carboxylesterase